MNFRGRGAAHSTKQVATLSGIAVTIIFFAVFTTSERMTKTRATEHAEVDQFNPEAGEDLSPEALRVQPGSILVMVRNYNTLASSLGREDGWCAL